MVLGSYENSFCKSPTTTNRKPTSISSTSMLRKDAPVTMLLAMLVVILVTFAEGQMDATVENPPSTANMTIAKMPKNRNPSPMVRMSASPMAKCVR